MNSNIHKMQVGKVTISILLLFLLPGTCVYGVFTPLNIDSVFNEQHSDMWDDGSSVNGHAYYESGCKTWFTGSEQTLDGIPFHLKINSFDTLSGSPGGIESFEIPINSSPRAIYLLGTAKLGSGTGVVDVNQFNLEIVYADGDTEEQIPLNTISGYSKWYTCDRYSWYSVASFDTGPQYGASAGTVTGSANIFTYVLIPNQIKPIRSIYFHDHSRDAEFCLFAVTLSDQIEARHLPYLGNVVRREHPYVAQPTSSTKPPVASGGYLMWDLSDYYNAEFNNAVSMGYGVGTGKQIALDPGFSNQNYTMEGIPFSVQLTGKNCVSSSFKGFEKYTFSIGQKANAIHLLMGAYLNMANYDEADPNYIRRYEYFMTEVKYTDGTVDKLFPYNPQNGEYRVYTVATGQIAYHYVVYPTQDKTIESFSICDGHDEAAYVLYAMTLDPAAHSWVEPAPATKLTKVADISPTVPVITRNGDIVTLENAYYRMILDMTPLKIISLYNKYISQECLNGNGSYPFGICFDPWGANSKYLPSDFTVGNINITNNGIDHSELTFQMNRSGSNFGLNVKFTLTQLGEIKFDVTIVNQSSVTQLCVLSLFLSNVQVGASAGDDYGFFPPSNGFIYNGPVDYRMPYGGASYLQIMDVSDYGIGGGVYYRMADESGDNKLLHMIRNGMAGEGLVSDATYTPPGGLSYSGAHQSGTAMCFELWNAYTSAGNSYTAPSMYIGVHKSNFRAGMYAYRDWMKTAYPQHEIPQWLKEMFYFTGGHLTVCHDDKNYRINTVQDVQNIQLFGWWNFPGNLNVGNNDEYSYRADWGGALSFHNAVQDAQNAGSNITLYLEGVLFPGHFNGGTWNSTLTADPMYPPDWTNSRASVMENPAGTPYGGLMCSGASLWQHFLADTCARLVRDTGVHGIYLDSASNTIPQACLSPYHNHGHYNRWNADVAELFRGVRERIRIEDPNACVFGEAAGTDRAAVEMDGAYTYYRYYMQVLGKPPINGLMHFFMPNRKLIGLYSFEFNIDTAKVAAFYGDAVAVRTSMGVGPTSLSPYRRNPHPEIHAIVNAMKPLWRQFTSEEAVPLVDTERYGLYANKFIATGYPTVYTLYNNNPYTLYGRLLEIGQGEGGLRDAVTGEAIVVEKSNGQCYINGCINPGEVLIIKSSYSCGNSSLISDFNGDCTVNLVDFSILASNWLLEQSAGELDCLNGTTITMIDPNAYVAIARDATNSNVVYAALTNGGLAVFNLTTSARTVYNPSVKYVALGTDWVNSGRVYAAHQSGGVDWITLPLQGARYMSWWRFEGNATATGSSPYNGTAVGTPGYGVDKIGQGLQLDGSGYYNMGFAPNVATAPTQLSISVASWVKYTDTGIGHIAGANYNWALNNIFGQVYFSIYGIHNGIASTTSLADGQWHQVVGTWDGSTIKLYVDGTLNVSDVANGTNPTYYGNSLYIGGGEDGNYSFKGSIDEVAVWRVALTPEQVADVYTNGVPEALGGVYSVSTLGTKRYIALASDVGRTGKVYGVSGTDGNLEYIDFGSSAVTPVVTNVNYIDVAADSGGFGQRCYAARANGGIDRIISNSIFATVNPGVVYNSVTRDLEFGDRVFGARSMASGGGVDQILFGTGSYFWNTGTVYRKIVEDAYSWVAYGQQRLFGTRVDGGIDQVFKGYDGTLYANRSGSADYTDLTFPPGVGDRVLAAKVVSYGFDMNDLVKLIEEWLRCTRLPASGCIE